MGTPDRTLSCTSALLDAIVFMQTAAERGVLNAEEVAPILEDYRAALARGYRAELAQSVSVRFAHVYGQVKCYPVNEQAQLIAALCKTKTLSPDALALARRLGFELRVEQASLEMLCAYLGEQVPA